VRGVLGTVLGVAMLQAYQQAHQLGNGFPPEHELVRLCLRNGRYYEHLLTWRRVNGVIRALPGRYRSSGLVQNGNFAIYAALQIPLRRG
jgi:hypothetical protein